jgi:hypothetical protein
MNQAQKLINELSLKKDLIFCLYSVHFRNLETVAEGALKNKDMNILALLKILFFSK